MKTLLFSFSLLLNSYCLPIPMQKSIDYDKKVEEVMHTSNDLETIKKRFFNGKEIYFKKLQAGEDMAESGKGSVIYYAYNNSDKAVAIVKKVPLDDHIDKKELIDEVSSLHERHFYHAKHIHVPKLIGTAEFSSDEETSAYIVETVAKGKSVNALVKETAKARGKKRAKLLKTLRHCVKSSAQSFAELHTTKTMNSYNSYYDNYYRDIHKEKFEGPYGIIHGDAHFGNIFYDDKSGEVTFIDLSFLPRSLSGAPVGLDSGEFLFNLEAIGSFYGLSDKEIKGLSNTYINTYVANNPSVSKEMLHDHMMLACKDFAYGSQTYAFEHENEGAYLYRFAKQKSEKA